MNNPRISRMAGVISDGTVVPLIMDNMSFEDRQNERLVNLEKKLQDELKRKKHQWRKEVDKMKDEFLHLYPSDKKWGSDELINDPLVNKRRGSTDILDPKKMKTLFLEYPDTGRRYKIRFNVSQFEDKSVRVSTDGERIIVRANREHEDSDGKIKTVEYVRKIEKPKEVDPTKIKAHLTNDGILIVEAPLPPQSLNLRKLSHSPSHSSQGSYTSHGSHGSRGSAGSSRSRSPSNSPRTPVAPTKANVPTFHGETDERILSLMIEIGNCFKPKDITLQVIKDNRIQVRAKHEERTSELLSKSRYFKEFELSEKIETLTLRGCLTDNCRLLIGALGKKHKDFDKKNSQEGAEIVLKDIQERNAVPCNVLDLANFPPVTTSVAKELPVATENSDS